MPQPFNNAVMTNDGSQLLMMAQAGEINIKFTKIATGSGIYSEEEKTLMALQSRTELKELKNSYPISDIEVFSEHSVKITTLITNQDPTTKETLVNHGYYINEIGLYAKRDGETDDTEVLYSVTVTAGENGDFMPPYNGYSPAQIIQDYYVTVANSSEVTIVSNGSTVLNPSEVKEIAKREISTHAIGTVYGENGVHGLRCRNGKLEALDGEGNWNTVLGSEQITDAVTGEVYTLGISDGVLTITGAEESGGNQNTNKIETSNVVSGVLSAGETGLTLEDGCITEDSTIDIYTTCYGVNPKTVEVTEGSITMTFKARVDDLQVKVVIK